MTSIPEHKDSILAILNIETDTMRLRYLLNPFHAVGSCWYAEPFLWQGRLIFWESEHISKYMYSSTSEYLLPRVSTPKTKKISINMQFINAVGIKHSNQTSISSSDIHMEKSTLN